MRVPPFKEAKVVTWKEIQTRRFKLIKHPLIEFIWYDGWVGSFYDRRRQILYICILPFFPIMFYLRKDPLTKIFVDFITRKKKTNEEN